MVAAKARGSPLRELTGFGERAAREVLDESQPAILRGLVAEWPAVHAACDSARALVSYLARFDNGSPVDALLTPPEVGGRIFYNETPSGCNFLRNRLALSAVAEQVLRYAEFPQPPSVAAQNALIPACLPGFDRENRLSILPHPVAPRLWLGSRITTLTHGDEWHNIACVVAGRRRFTLFPPDQVSNLYIGPLDFAPTGAAMSLVSLHAPDTVRYPKLPRCSNTTYSRQRPLRPAIFRRNVMAYSESRLRKDARSCGLIWRGSSAASSQRGPPLLRFIDAMACGCPYFPRHC